MKVSKKIQPRKSNFRIPKIIQYLFLFLLSFFAYTFSAKPFNTTDSYPNSFTAMNILFNRRIDLTNFGEALERRGIILITSVNDQGTRYSKTPPILGVLAVPTYALLNAFFGVKHMSVEDMVFSEYSQYIGKISAAGYAALSVVLLFWIARKLFEKGRRTTPWIVALVFALCTGVFNTASQANWQHAISLALILISICVYLMYGKKTLGLVVVGLLLGLYAQIRVSNAFFAVFFAAHLFLAFKRWRDRIGQLACIAVPSMVVYFSILYWYSRLGVPNGYQSEILFSLQNWSFPLFLQNMAALLGSFNYGLLWYSPILIFGFFGLFFILFHFRKQAQTELGRFMLSGFPVTLLYIAFASSWWMWTGGTSMNARMLIELLPILAVGVGVIWDHVRNKTIELFIVCTMLFSFGVNILTTYMMNFLWYDFYVSRGHLSQIKNAWFNEPSLFEYLWKERLFYLETLEQKDGDLFVRSRVYRVGFKYGGFPKLFDNTKLLLSKQQKNSTENK